MWFSNGGTKSVLHYDSAENINCLFAGTKELYLIDPNKYEDQVRQTGSHWLIMYPIHYQTCDQSSNHATFHPPLSFFKSLDNISRLIVGLACPF